MSHIETQVWLPDNSAMTAILGDASSAQWTDVFGDVGAGSVAVSWYDPKLPYCLRGALVKFVLGGVPVFSFFNDSPKLTIAEASASVLTMAGRSVLAYLRFALVDPAGGISAPSGATQTFTGTPGAMLVTLLGSAQSRGTCPALTWDFSAARDSAGAAWAGSINLTFDAKASLLDVVLKLSALGWGVRMDPQLGLHLFNPGTLGANLSSTVIWRYGRHVVGPVDNVGSSAEMSTVCHVEGTGDVWLETSDPTYTNNPYVGRRESALDYSSVTSDLGQMTAAGKAQTALTETAATALTIPLNHGSNGLFEPYVDYRVGDTVGWDDGTSSSATPWQVVGLTIAQTSNDYTVSANLGSIALPLDLALVRQASSIAGSVSSVSRGSAGYLTLGNPK